MIILKQLLRDKLFIVLLLGFCSISLVGLNSYQGIDNNSQNNNLVFADMSPLSATETVTPSATVTLTATNTSTPPFITPLPTYTSSPTATATVGETDTPTLEPSPTSSPTPTRTGTITPPTSTLTPSITPTGTNTTTPTITGTLPTLTPTITGTRPTPTATGTITPNISLTNSVTPSQALIRQELTFTVRVINQGTAPAYNVIVQDTLPTYLNIKYVNTTKGTIEINYVTRTIKVTIPSVNPYEYVTIQFLTRVNNTLLYSQTLSNYASLVYTFGVSTYSKVSNAVSFRLLVSPILPGTGEHSPSLTPARSEGSQFPSDIFIGLFSLVSIGSLIKRIARKTPLEIWFLMIAILLIAFVWINSMWFEKNKPGAFTTIIVTSQLALSNELNSGNPEGLVVVGDAPEFDMLPDYPIPKPNLKPSDDNKLLDTSAIRRIRIPSIEINAIVKYVPFDGFSWKISGLRDEVAWMGNTSWPGLGSNTALAGHINLRTGQEGPFSHLDKLVPGDKVIVYTEQNIYTYRVSAQQVVDDIDLSVIQATDKSQLTLVTCVNWDENLRVYLQRLVVISNLESVKSRDVERSQWILD